MYDKIVNQIKELVIVLFFSLRKEKERQKNGSCAVTQLPIIYNCLSTSNMIIYNSTKVKKFNKNCIKKYKTTENFKIVSCPNCGSEEIIKWGKYTRNIIYYKNKEKRENTIEIKRIRCNKCGKTQSIIPNFLIPYKIHITEYITEVIKRKITIKDNYKEVSEKYQISRQLIKYWLECFSKHYTRIIVTLREKNKKKIIREIQKEIYKFIEKYYKENKQIYMMYIPNEISKPILKWAPT